MRVSLVLVLLSVALLPVPAGANSCTAKRLTVKNVCGIVVDGAGVPIRGATLQLVSPSGEPVSPRVATENGGTFDLEPGSVGDLFLSIEAPQHNSGKWPLKVTGNKAVKSCKNPLTVHLAGCLGCGCGDYVSKK
jgi:hypothetical protein